jgi:hypothetical protein
MLVLIRFGLLHRAGDRRAASAAAEAVQLAVPAAARTPQVFAILTDALRVALETEPTEAEFDALDRAMEAAPEENLPDLLLLKARTLLASATTGDEVMRACWPLLRVAIHMPKDGRAAEALLVAASGLDRLGRADRAAALLAECLGNPAITPLVKERAEVMLARFGGGAAKP